jgi:hypothetical protein
VILDRKYRKRSNIVNQILLSIKTLVSYLGFNNMPSTIVTTKEGMSPTHIMEFSLKLVEVLYGKEIAKLVDWRER